jgi:hypothetical protein
MNNSTRQAIFVALFALGSIGAFLVFVALRQGHANERLFKGFMEHSLKSLYSSVTAAADGNSPPVHTIKPHDIQDAISEERLRHFGFPSPIGPRDFLVGQFEVDVPSTNLICVLRISSSCQLGLDAAGTVRQVRDRDLAGWKHEPGGRH